MQDKITQSEWIIVVLVAGLIGSLGTASYLNSNTLRIKYRMASLVALQDQKIEISVEGAVENPGLIVLKPGCTLKEVLKISRLSRSADRKKVDFEKIIYKSSRIIIPHKMSVPKRARAKQNSRA